MAIIVRERGPDGIHARPVLDVANVNDAVMTSGPFLAQMAEAREHLGRAIRAVARVEMADSPAAFMGTAFAVGQNIYVTASYVGELIEQKLRQASGQAIAWLDPSDAPTPKTRKLPIREVHRVHPHWQVAFLEVEGDAEPIPLAPVRMGYEIEGRSICVIGYPAMDVRNKPEELQEVFGDIWGEKRLMPGMVRGTMVSWPENTLMVEHDASTSGGTGGSPLLDLATGAVIGVQHSGLYLVGNWAVPAWELTRDPQWSRLWGSGRSLQAAPPAVGTPSHVDMPNEVFSFDEITRLNEIVMASSIATEEDVHALFAGLPPTFLATLPLAAKVGDRLRLGLIQMNWERVKFGGRLPLYYVIKNAAIRRSFDEAYGKSLEPFLTILDEARSAAPGATPDE